MSDLAAFLTAVDMLPATSLIHRQIAAAGRISAEALADHTRHVADYDRGLILKMLALGGFIRVEIESDAGRSVTWFVAA